MLSAHATGATRDVVAVGVFVYIGLRPNTDLVSGLLTLDADRWIMMSATRRSTLAPIFAAGDIRAGSPSLLGSTAGDGDVADTATVQATHKTN